MAGECHLFHVIGAFDTSSGRAYLLYSREQKSNQDSDDRNYNQQFDECERSPSFDKLEYGHEITSAKREGRRYTTMLRFS
jgi:hypothetical protein